MKKLLTTIIGNTLMAIGLGISLVFMLVDKVINFKFKRGK